MSLAFTLIKTYLIHCAIIQTIPHAHIHSQIFASHHITVTFIHLPKLSLSIHSQTSRFIFQLLELLSHSPFYPLISLHLSSSLTNLIHNSSNFVSFSDSLPSTAHLSTQTILYDHLLCPMLSFMHSTFLFFFSPNSMSFRNSLSTSGRPQRWWCEAAWPSPGAAVCPSPHCCSSLSPQHSVNFFAHTVGVTWRINCLLA